MASSIKFFLTGIAVSVALSIASTNAAYISGAGTTSAFPVIAKLAELYKGETGNSVNYQAIGSGGGIRQITAGTVNFGTSDSPLTPSELAAGGLVQWPMVIGGTVLVVNIDAVQPNDITLDGPTVAKIYLGNITSWDDAAIKRLNPSVTLPSAPIVVVHRSDGSGTTFYFTNYLSKVNDDWKTRVGSGASVQWPTGIGAKGDDGVAHTVQQSKNSIGYVDTAYALQNKMTTTKMVNKDGNAIISNGDTIKAAAANADWAHSDGFYLILTDQPGAKAWPISGATFVLMQKSAPNAAAARETLNFLKWCYESGDETMERLQYAPLPENVKELIEAKWRDIRGPDGKPVLAN